MQHEDLTRRIIAAAMKVHSTLGNGFQEVIYQRALEIEFPYYNLAFEREKEMSIHYRGHEIGTRRVDFFIENLIMVELKAVIQLEDAHLAQAMNYLEAYKMEIGRVSKLEVIRSQRGERVFRIEAFHDLAMVVAINKETKVYCQCLHSP